LLSLLMACSLSMPATMQDVAEYQHCLEYHDVWVLGLEWSNLIQDHFESKDHETAYRVIGCESWGIPTAKNPTSTAKGLWQFIDKTWTWVESKLKIKGSAFDPHLSTHYASFLVYNTEQGWGHWSESAHCWEAPNEKNKPTKIN